ncbi:hypothetical protein HALLA_17935 [Halostagnicola larsenii XH-48]|uniref:Uncharacterized protein n=1 Tax=Halostagnicola larsenii XH-48 TaxID=797299 RepID=W0JSX6_9EURY|nr:DUF5787 family protein [Halostagnicola larsenii]AHG00397.1 hypothetical protein HALLA_17935 [Halostagnicola larsenii XH-48]
MSEFAFELELCAHLESVGRPETADTDIVARQLGGAVAKPGGRILDIVCVEPGPAFEDRLALTSETIPDAAIEADVGPGTARYWKRAFPDDCHPERAKSAVERALEIDFFEADLRNGRRYVRQVARYPDWYGRIVGIENKPDLGTPGDLEAQLRTDASLGLVDEAVLATESYVTRAHLNRIPEEIGVWRVSRGERSEGSTAGALEIEVIREPTPLAVDEPGVEPLEYQPGHTDIAIVPPERKARTRRRIAERAFGKGWRTFRFPDCEACEPTNDGGGETSDAVGDGRPGDSGSGATTPLPFCQWKGRVVDAESECGPACPGYKPGAEPEIDLETERDRRTPWRRDPSGRRRRQSGLDQFG